VASLSLTKVILLVEDDMDVRATVHDLLSDEGYSVVVTRNGAEALAYLKQTGSLPDLILLDLLMPVMDGWQFRAEQKRDPRISCIPLVVYSAIGGPRPPIDAQAVLAKPVCLKDLLSTLERHIA